MCGLLALGSRSTLDAERRAGSPADENLGRPARRAVSAPGRPTERHRRTHATRKVRNRRERALRAPEAVLLREAQLRAFSPAARSARRGGARAASARG